MATIDMVASETVQLGGKYPSTPHLPFSPGKQDDDTVLSTSAAASGRLFTEDIIITEKLDGGNCCIMRGRVYARSHSHQATHPWFGTIKSMRHVLEATSNDDALEIFGENMTATHSIEYSNLTSYFYVFGVRRQGQWLDWAEVERIADSLDLPTVPVLFKGRLSSSRGLQALVEESITKPSKCGNHNPEGFVVRISCAFSAEDFSHCIAKYVREGHIQTGNDFTRIWPRNKARLVGPSESRELGA
jgi:hypothetical protein